MKTAVLRGREHPILGAVAAVSEDSAAIALSRGGAAKRYAYVDPNEDAAAFVAGPAGVLLAVADGHGGHPAAEVAVEQLAAGWAGAWTQPAAAGLREAWEERAAQALGDLCGAIHHQVACGGRETARTTVSAALLRPTEGWLGWVAIGDSHLFVLEDSEAHELAPADPSALAFLGHPAETPESLPGKLRSGTRSLRGLRGVALVTDGLSERGIGVDSPVRAVAEAAREARERVGEAGDRLALEIARGIVQAALDAHRAHRSGDNVAAAVAILAGPRAP
jgi:hypothetical protein